MRAMPHARAQIMLPSSRVATPPSTSCARPRAVPDRRRRHRASIPFPRRSLAPRAKRQYDSAADAEEDLLFWNEEDLEDDDPIAIEDEEDWDDEDDDEDDDWFFVPEGANVRVVNEDLFNIDDEDNGGGYVMDFVRVPTKNDRASGSSEAVNTSLKSPKKNPRGVASADAKPKRVVGESSEINAKRDDKGMKKEDIERMVRMGVPRDLLFAIEEEKQEVAAFNKKKEYEATRKTHKRMAIVAGKYARRKLLSPSGLDTRPMMSMVRGATFDMMLNFLGSRSNVQFPPDSRWLDMFCGTGAIGIESISRGVVEAHFVEMDPWVVNNVTNKNLNSLGLTKQTTTHTASVQAFMNQHHKKRPRRRRRVRFHIVLPSVRKSIVSRAPPPARRVGASQRLDHFTRRVRQRPSARHPPEHRQASPPRSRPALRPHLRRFIRLRRQGHRRRGRRRRSRSRDQVRQARSPRPPARRRRRRRMIDSFVPRALITHQDTISFRYNISSVVARPHLRTRARTSSAFSASPRTTHRFASTSISTARTPSMRSAILRTDAAHPSHMKSTDSVTSVSAMRATVRSVIGGCDSDDASNRDGTRARARTPSRGVVERSSAKARGARAGSRARTRRRI